MPGRVPPSDSSREVDAGDPPRDLGPVPLASIAERIRGHAPRCGPVRLVCLDGPAGAGKTAFADRLADALGGAGVVHMDDVYDGWVGALGPELVARLTTGLLDRWRRGLPGEVPRYDWAAESFTSTLVVPAEPVVLLEGVGAASRGIREYAVLVVWVTAAPELLPERVIARDGPQVAAPMVSWRVAEAHHFAGDGTLAAADLVVDGSPRVPHDPEREVIAGWRVPNVSPQQRLPDPAAGLAPGRDGEDG